jgi:hypothetical protein
MLPYPISAPPSPNPANYLDDDDDPDEKKRAPQTPIPLALRRLLQDPSLVRHHKPALAASSFLVLVLLYLLLSSSSFFSGSHAQHVALKWGAHAVDNWGDHVGLGRARPGVLESTPSPYADIGDKFFRGNGPLYRTRKMGEVEMEQHGKPAARNFEFERDRHGIMGGASVEWSAGVVGSGIWLGDTVDMRKDSSSQHQHPLMTLSTRAERSALTDHILENGWKYLDSEDEINSKKLIAEAREKGFMDSLPLRDRVRGDPVKSREAALGWSRIYTVMEGEWRKSALEVVVEKMVRRVPVVVFSKTTCP